MTDEFRRLADDASEPYLYSDVNIARWAAEAEREACVRANLIYDTTSSFLAITVVDGTATYAIDERIVRIDRILYTPTNGTATKLTNVGIEWLEDADDGFQRTGKPTHFARTAQGTIRLWPEPDSGAVGALALAVYRLPLSDLEDGADEPEIGIVHHEGLIDWMLYRAYQGKDGEASDPERSKYHLNEFEARFGPRPTAKQLRKQREQRRVTTRYPM